MVCKNVTAHFSFKCSCLKWILNSDVLVFSTVPVSYFYCLSFILNFLQCLVFFFLFLQKCYEGTVFVCGIKIIHFHCPAWSALHFEASVTLQHFRAQWFCHNTCSNIKCTLHFPTQCAMGFKCFWPKKHQFFPNRINSWSYNVHAMCLLWGRIWILKLNLD